MQVFWFERWYLIRLMMSTFEPVPSSSSGLTTMRAASTDSTTPSRLATTVTPESRATTASMPVPTSGASVRSSGTAWRCMFEPISARFASSFSRNGISDAATDTSWFGDTSIISTSSGGDHRRTRRPCAPSTTSRAKLPVLVERRVRLRDREPLLVERREVLHLVADTRPSAHRRGTASR